jgi:hypothetical protein
MTVLPVSANRRRTMLHHWSVEREGSGADLRVGFFVMVTCKSCGHQSEVSAITLRERLPRDEFVTHIGMRFSHAETAQPHWGDFWGDFEGIW